MDVVYAQLDARRPTAATATATATAAVVVVVVVVEEEEEGEKEREGEEEEEDGSLGVCNGNEVLKRNSKLCLAE